MHWYVTQLALAFGSDYQDFAPLPGRASAQPGQTATVSHSKSRGKGPALFMKTLEHALNWHGVMPKNVTFSFGEQDNGAKYEKVLLMKEYALTLQIMVEAGIITDQVARQMMADEGFLDQTYLDLMGEGNIIEDVTQPGSEHVAPVPSGVTPGDPAPKEPPAVAATTAAATASAAGAPQTPSKANSNRMRTRPPGSTQRPSVPA